MKSRTPCTPCSSCKGKVLAVSQSASDSTRYAWLHGGPKEGRVVDFSVIAHPETLAVSDTPQSIVFGPAPEPSSPSGRLAAQRLAICHWYRRTGVTIDVGEVDDHGK